eukprot:6194933-Pleurochrysis_carterae.AAC.3
MTQCYCQCQTRRDKVRKGYVTATRCTAYFARYLQRLLQQDWHSRPFTLTLKAEKRLRYQAILLPTRALRSARHSGPFNLGAWDPAGSWASD